MRREKRKGKKGIILRRKGRERERKIKKNRKIIKLEKRFER